jgi:PAS domain S-box-containing protein
MDFIGLFRYNETMGILSVVFMAFVGFTLFMAGLYFYLFARSQERFIQYWGLCWVFYSLSLLFLILGENLQESRLFEIRKVFDVLNILCLLFGVYSFSNRRIPGYWMRFTLYLMIWVAVSVFYQFDIMAIYLPLSMFQMAITTVLVAIIFSHWETKKLQKWMAMVVFLLWGYGKAMGSIYEGYFSGSSTLYLAEIIFSNVLNFIIFILYLERTTERMGFAEKIFKMMAENASDVIFIYSFKPNPSFSYITPSVERMLGYTPQDFYGDSRFYLNVVDSSEVERIQELFDPRHPKSQEQETGLFRLLHKNTGPLWGEMKRTLIYENGEAVAIEGILRDVTTTKEAEEQLLTSKNAREQLLSYISHELKTPVTSILGYITALRDGTLNMPEDRQTALDTIFKKTLMLENLILDLFQLSKLETKQFSFQFSLMGAEELAEELVKNYGLDVRNAGMKLALSRERKELSKHNVIVDNQRMGQVFNNILQNAIRYSKPGDSIQVKFFIERSRERLVFTVSDKGPGIPTGEMSQIFQRFYKGKDEGAGKNSGNSGLGLTICKEIVEAHHGTIEVKSSVGRGSTFVVAIPLYQD